MWNQVWKKTRKKMSLRASKIVQLVLTGDSRVGAEKTEITKKLKQYFLGTPPIGRENNLSEKL